MGLFSFVAKQFVDVIEWDNQPDGQLMWRFPFTDNEIQYGAQLTVRDGQIAVFVNEGQVADVFTAGLYKLETRTLTFINQPKKLGQVFCLSL
jgi:membrane protease subunit (stomatin/prohibitin family)